MDSRQIDIEPPNTLVLTETHHVIGADQLLTVIEEVTVEGIDDSSLEPCNEAFKSLLLSESRTSACRLSFFEELARIKSVVSKTSFADCRRAFSQAYKTYYKKALKTHIAAGLNAAKYPQPTSWKTIGRALTQHMYSA